MGKLGLMMLLATGAAVPALAAPGDWNGRQPRVERQQFRAEQRDSRADFARSDRVERLERAPQVERVDRTPRIEQIERTQTIVQPRARVIEVPVHSEAIGRADQRDFQAIRDARRQAVEQAIERRAPPGAQVLVPMQRDGAATARGDRLDQRVRQTQDRLAAIRASRQLPVSTTPQPGTQPPPPSMPRTSLPVEWNTAWRSNSSYDWHNYRDRHRSLFHLGFYYDPFGWGYQPYMIGWRMWPSYYSSQYWLNDPWMYRLPYAPPGYRWVRYWDDAVLVDMWSGQVVDVIYNFFW